MTTKEMPMTTSTGSFTLEAYDVVRVDVGAFTHRFRLEPGGLVWVESRRDGTRFPMSASWDSAQPGESGQLLRRRLYDTFGLFTGMCRECRHGHQTGTYCGKEIEPPTTTHSEARLCPCQSRNFVTESETGDPW